MDYINLISGLLSIQSSKWAILHHEQDKSSDIEQQPPFGDRKYSNALPQKRGGIHNQQEHHITWTKYEAVQPTN